MPIRRQSLQELESDRGSKNDATNEKYAPLIGDTKNYPNQRKRSEVYEVSIQER